MGTVARIHQHFRPATSNENQDKGLVDYFGFLNWNKNDKGGKKQ
jgi:hypothetical protein